MWCDDDELVFSSSRLSNDIKHYDDDNDENHENIIGCWHEMMVLLLHLNSVYGLLMAKYIIPTHNYHFEHCTIVVHSGIFQFHQPIHILYIIHTFFFLLLYHYYWSIIQWDLFSLLQGSNLGRGLVSSFVVYLSCRIIYITFWCIIHTSAR